MDYNDLHEFAFKNFVVKMSDDVFKVGTDATLLGALTQVAQQDKRLLEIGTGSGVVALMMAQRFPELHIDAIDISSAAAELADYNFKSSVFADRLASIHRSASEFSSAEPYDVIITNPPYHFTGTLSLNSNIAAAKHEYALPIKGLVQAVGSSLKPKGQFWVVAPPSYIDELTMYMKVHHFRPKEIVSIRHHNSSKISRLVVCYSREHNTIKKSSLYLYEEGRTFSKEAHDLLKDFLTVL